MYWGIKALLPAQNLKQDVYFFDRYSIFIYNADIQILMFSF